MLTLSFAANTHAELHAQITDFLSADGVAPSPVARRKPAASQPLMSPVSSPTGGVPLVSDAPRRPGRKPKDSAVAPLAADSPAPQPTQPLKSAEPATSHSDAGEAQPAVESDQVSSAPPAAAVSYEQFRAKLQGAADKHGLPAIIALLAKGGFQKVSQLAGDDRAADRAAIAAEADAL